MEEKIVGVKISTFICKNCGKINTRARLIDSNGHTMPMLFIGQKCSHFCMYWPDAFYDDKLREKFASGSLICPKCNKSRLIRVEGLTVDEDKLECEHCDSASIYLLHEHSTHLNDVFEK